jgi:hydrogenase-4 component B
MTQGLLLLIAFAALTASICTGFRRPRLWLSLTVIGAAFGACAALWALLGTEIWDWHGGFMIGGEALHLRLDGLSALFLMLLSVVGGAGAVYSHEYWTDDSHPASAPRGRACWSALMICMGLVLTVSNGMHFLIAWELFTICSYFLITLDRERKEVRAAGWLYLVASHAGTLCLFVFFTLLETHTGSWDLGPMREHAELAPLFWLALFGFGVKAGYFPLHIWLPSAHANAPSHVSAIMSGVAIKMGIYGIVRFSGWLPMPDGAGWAVALLGVVSAVLGVAFALGQHDLKRLLAYHSVENIGIILIGLGFALVAVQQGSPLWGQLALAGALLHVWNHGLFKALLFLGAGSVLHATGTREMSRLGGLWRAMPWTAALFALGAAAISGLPPLNGFVSEWLVFLGLFDAALSHGPSAWVAVPAAILLGVTGALALACFAKVCGVVFLGAPRSAAAHAHESGLTMRVPMLVLAGLCVAIGLAPILFWPSISRAVACWCPVWTAGAPSAPLATLGAAHITLTIMVLAAAVWLWRKSRANGLRRGPTWDCGYATPTPRMQYTSASFAGIISEWFRWILIPERKVRRPRGFFPTEAFHMEHVPETVLERVITPLASIVMKVSTAVRRLQHGRLQFYILYLLIGLIALGVLVFWGRAQ